MIRFSTRPPQSVFVRKDRAPFGPVLVGFTNDNELCLLFLLSPRLTEKQALAEAQQAWPETTFERRPSTSASLFAPGTPPPALLMVGTPFQHDVWRALAKVPFGRTLTYAELAARAGHPKAARAVGHALGANPIPFFVPCHRILAANGIGGFSGGLDIKRKLLALEGHSF